jgi:hypothetical protein
MKTKEEGFAGAQGRDSSAIYLAKAPRTQRTQREEEKKFFLGSIA